MVYDVMDQNSFNHVQIWLKEVEENAEKDCLIMLVGNKAVLNDRQTVFVRDRQSFARKNGLMFIEMSALNSTGVDTAFQRILQETYKNTNQKEIKSVNVKGEELEYGVGGQFQAGRVQAISLSAAEPDKIRAQKEGCCG